MNEEHIKVFTGTAIFVNRLKHLLEESNIQSVVKDHISAGVIAGFGTLDKSIELFVLNSDLQEANSIIDKFQKEISE